VPDFGDAMEASRTTACILSLVERTTGKPGFRAALSSFTAADFGGIGIEFVADIKGSKP